MARREPHRATQEASTLQVVVHREYQPLCAIDHRHNPALTGTKVHLATSLRAQEIGISMDIPCVGSVGMEKQALEKLQAAAFEAVEKDR